MSDHNTWTIPEPKADYIVLSEEEYNRRLGELEELRAELARLRELVQWEPVTVGFIRCTTSSHSMQVEMDTEGQLVAIGPYGEHSVTAFDMPEGYAICRRNADAQPDA